MTSTSLNLLFFSDYLEQASSARQSTFLDSHSEFIGHCCLIDKSFRLETDPVHPNQHRCDRSREHSIDSRLSGCIFFPEFLLFIDSPIDCMDIHTVGGEYEMKESNKRDTCRSSSSSSKHQNKHEYLPPRWHGVVPHDFAVENAMLAPDRNGEFPDDWKSMYINNHKIALPHDENIFKMYNLKIIIIKATRKFDTSRKGCNNPTSEELSNSYLFCGKGPQFHNSTSKLDITLILGMDKGSSYASILLCRFHKLHAKLSTKAKSNLMSCLWEKLKLRKYECRRTGGSSGVLSSSPPNLIRELMRFPGACPRNGVGSIWIRGIDAWFLYYIGTTDGIAKRCCYMNPVPGGSLLLDHAAIKKYKFLSHFISTKPITAVLIKSLAKKFKNSKDFCVNICPQAINAELKNIEETRLIVIHRDRSRNSKLPIDLKLAAELNIPKCSKFQYFYTVYNLNFVKATFVLHAVGFHRDTFADGDPSLENKVVIDIPKSEVPFFKFVKYFPNGRGGGSGKNDYAFGILDWSSGHRVRRRTWTDPANAHLPHAPTTYAAEQALTQQIWNNFFQCNVHIPNGVTVAQLNS